MKLFKFASKIRSLAYFATLARHFAPFAVEVLLTQRAQSEDAEDAKKINLDIGNPESSAGGSCFL